ncbi:NAD-binding rossmann-fold containing protein [Colletotrichum truncatum]|uniref:NAD-binding rossmann-fold containing protein n=1 Tax=Colletotrichum truncatum TaxID=5467 RepID=A0ACC3YRY8_COLTU|nr:NAD-binding rossmann-fold containing protein [Colletotrichum truncatum]KAF6789939.1 NAD-binding rossmann-fold containing protein [Colletotrichum truncatum]
MKAIVMNDFVTDLNEIRVSEIDRPIAKPDDILVQVKAAGVNYVDTLYAKGKHQNNRSLVRPPFILGLEFSGVVLSAPPGSGWQAGDRVFGGCTGSYSEVISIPISTPLHRIPEKWTFTEAAGIAATLPVSYAALVNQAGIKSGQTVLIHAAAGGLGIMAVQVAVALGCRVIGTAGSSAKCAVATRFGAHVCLDYTQDSTWWERVLQLTDGKGADIVFDSVGLVEPSLKCIAHRGKLLIVGFAGLQDGMEMIAMNRILLKQVSLIGYRFGESARRYPEEHSAIWSGLWPLIEKGSVQPVVYESDYYGLGSVPRALTDMVERRIWGKAVINLGGLLTDSSHAKL